MISPFVIKVVFGEYYHVLHDVYIYSVKRAPKYRRNIPFSVMSADTIRSVTNHTASHLRCPQASQTMESNMYKFIVYWDYIHKFPNIFNKKTSELVSQTL